jgi:hypothetical protein
VTTLSSNIAVLTTSLPRPCTNTDLGWPQTLGANDVAVLWMEASLPGFKVTSLPGRSTNIGGHPARVAVLTPSARALGLVCGATSGAQRLVLATIQLSGGAMRMAACLSGPDFESNQAAVRQMLSSVRLSTT